MDADLATEEGLSFAWRLLPFLVNPEPRAKIPASTVCKCAFCLSVQLQLNSSSKSNHNDPGGAKWGVWGK